MLFLQVFATYLTFCISGLQAQFSNADLLKNIKDYGLVSKNYLNNLPLKSAVPVIPGDLRGKLASCQNLQTLWHKIGCQGSIHPEAQLPTFRDSVVTLGNEMTLRYLQKYSKLPLPAEMISTIRSKRFEDHVPHIVNYIGKYLPKVCAEKKLLNQVLYEIDEYIFKPLIKYLVQFPRTVHQQDSDYEDYLRGKDISNIIRQYIREPLDQVVPVTGNSYQQNRPAIIKYITQHAPRISRNLLNILLCKIQEKTFGETPKSGEIDGGLPSNELHRLTPHIYNVLNNQYQPWLNNVISKYYPQMHGDKPFIDSVPKETDDGLQGVKPEEGRPEKPTISGDEPEELVNPGLNPFQADKPEKLVVGPGSYPSKVYKPEQSVKPESYPFEENSPEKSTTESNPAKEDRPGQSVRPGSDPFEEDKRGQSRPESDPLEEDKPGQSVRPGSPVDEPSETDPSEKDKPEQSVRPESTPSQENQPQDSSTDETDPEKDLLLKFLKKYYPEQFGDQFIIPTPQETTPATDGLTKQYLNKDALLKFLEKFYPELLGKKQFIDELSKTYQVDVPNSGYYEIATNAPVYVVPEGPTRSPDFVVTKPEYIPTDSPTSKPVSGPTSSDPLAPEVTPSSTGTPNVVSPVSGIPESDLIYSQVPLVRPTIISTVTPNIYTKPSTIPTVAPETATSPSTSPVSLIPIRINPKVITEIRKIKPSPIPTPAPTIIIRKPIQYPKPIVNPDTQRPINEKPESPLQPTMLPTPEPNVQDVLERLRERYPHVYNSDKFLKVYLQHLEKKLNPENTQPGTESTSIDLSSYIRQHFPNLVREERPNNIWGYEYPQVDVQPVTPTPGPGAYQIVPVIPGKEGIKDTGDDQPWSDVKPDYNDPDNIDEPNKPRVVGGDKIYGPQNPEDIKPYNIDDPNKPRLTGQDKIYGPQNPDDVKPETVRLPGKYYANHNFMVHHKNIFKVSRPMYPNVYQNQLMQMPNKEAMPGNLIWKDAQEPMIDMSKVYGSSQMPEHFKMPFQSMPFANDNRMKTIKVKYSSGGHIYSTNHIPHGNDFMRTLYGNDNIGPQSDSSLLGYKPFSTQFNYPQVDGQQSSAVQQGNQDYKTQLNNQLKAELMGLLYQNHLSPLMVRSYGQLYEKLRSGASLSDPEWNEMHKVEDMFSSHAAFLQLYQQKFARSLHGLKSLLYNMYKTLYKMGQNARYGTVSGQNNANKFIPVNEGSIYNSYGQQPLMQNAAETVQGSNSELNPPEQVNIAEEAKEDLADDSVRKSAFDNINERLGAFSF